MTDNNNSEFVNVFSKKFTGGPLGLGDPEDRTLRHVEETVYIKQLIKDRAHHEKCKEKIKKWGNCMEENGSGWKAYLTFYTCKKECDEMNECLKHYYTSPEFRQECTDMYLDKRARYRRTGVIEKDPYHKMPYYESSRKKDFAEWLKAQKEKENHPKQNEETKA